VALRAALSNQKSRNKASALDISALVLHPSKEGAKIYQNNAVETSNLLLRT
jgi:hypothetical protein